MGGTAIRMAGVWKRFRLGESHDSLRDMIGGFAARLLGRGVAGSDAKHFWVLRDVELSIRHGEAVGMIGPNGAGKSTLLRLLAGILRPDRGTVSVHGRLAALIEIGAGFHGDLTGRENVYLNGAILGMGRAEIRRKFDAIVDFSGVGRFIDMPVKRYSSGMYARLGFSIAAHVDPAVLLVDEVLAVGDAAFRLRCLERMTELVRGGTALVFVTHHLEQVASICGRAVVLEGGATCFAGPSHDAVAHYLKAMSRSFIGRPPDLPGGVPGAARVVELVGVSVCAGDGEATGCIRSRGEVRLTIAARFTRPVSRLIVECNLRGAAHEGLVSVNSGRDGVYFRAVDGVSEITLRLRELPLAGGEYFWNVRMWDADSGEALLDSAFGCAMVVDDGGCPTGVMSLPHDWHYGGSGRRLPMSRPARVSQAPAGPLGEAGEAPAPVAIGGEVGTVYDGLIRSHFDDGERRPQAGH